MRRASAGLAFASLVAAVVTVFACTGSDPDAPSADGRGVLNQACLANDKCLGSLACVNGLCVTNGQSLPDGSVTAEGGQVSPGDAAAVDAGPPCERAGAICDSFDGYNVDSLSVGWVRAGTDNSDTFLDQARFRSGPNALVADTGSPDTGRIHAMRVRTAPSNGAAIWTTFVYLKEGPRMVDPQRLLELQFTDSTTKAGTLALELLPDGFQLTVNGSTKATPGNRIVPTYDDWTELKIDFNLGASSVRAYVNGNSSSALTSEGPILGDGGSVSEVTMSLGIDSGYTGSKIRLWFDDVQLIPK